MRKKLVLKSAGAFYLLGWGIIKKPLKFVIKFYEINLMMLQLSMEYLVVMHYKKREKNQFII